jgi:glycosyltransferase involved in cell wall biosynthesis
MRKTKNKLLIVNQNAGYLTIDVTNAMLSNYDEVSVMTGRIIVTDRTFDKNVKIQKSIAYNRKSNIARFMTWILFTMHLCILLAWKYRKHTILYYTNPPFSYFNSLIYKNTMSIVVFDVYPDALGLIGLKESNWIYKLWKNMNKKIFSNAEQIITLSEGMKSQISKYTSNENIKVVSIWSATEKFKPITKSNNDFLKNHNWQDKFIILYSGNMGLGHQLNILIEAAKDLCYDTSILFLFIGEGAKKNKLKNLASSHKLENVVFLSWQSADVLPYSLAAADIAVVSLEADATNASVPSKTFNYMAVGAPVLCIGSSGSELENLIHLHQNGIFIHDNDVTKIKNFIYQLKDDKNLYQQYRKNSLEANRCYTQSLANNYIF